MEAADIPAAAGDEKISKSELKRRQKAELKAKADAEKAAAKVRALIYGCACAAVFRHVRFHLCASVARILVQLVGSLVI